MTMRETDPTARAPDDEPVTQSTPDLFVYQAPDPDPAAKIQAEEDDEVQAVFDDDVDPSDETEAVVEADDEADEVDTYDDETDSDAAELEAEVESEETDVETESDGQPEHNGDGQAEPDPETLDPQDDAEVVEAPADGATEDRPFLSDGGVFEERWNAIQISFVDDPRQAVQSADHLVTEAIDDLAKILVNKRELLQAQWDDDVDTEQLRVVFRDYRALLLGLLHT